MMLFPTLCWAKLKSVIPTTYKSSGNDLSFGVAECPVTPALENWRQNDAEFKDSLNIGRLLSENES